METYAHQNKCAVPESCIYWFCHHHKRCLLHEHVERNIPKVEVTPTPIFGFFSRNTKPEKRRKKSGKKVIELPQQPTPITIDNFFIRTSGVYDEIQSIPEGFHCFFRSKGSAYWTNEFKTHVVRVSDHWGFNIRFCAWFLKENHNGTYDRISSFKWKKIKGKENRIGIIHISNFSINGKVSRQPKSKDWKYKTVSRWPE